MITFYCKKEIIIIFNLKLRTFYFEMEVVEIYWKQAANTGQFTISRILLTKCRLQFFKQQPTKKIINFIQQYFVGKETVFIIINSELLLFKSQIKETQLLKIVLSLLIAISQLQQLKFYFPIPPIYSFSNPIINLFIMSEVTYHDKLISAFNVLISSKTRHQLGENKQKIRQILQESSTTSDSYAVLEEFLACSIQYPKLSSLAKWIFRSNEFFPKYSKILETIARRYIQNNSQVSKLDEQSAKCVRLILARKMIQDQSLLSELINSSKSDQGICDKFLKTICEYFKENKKISGNINSLVALCLNVLRVKEHVNHNIVRSSLQILKLVFSSCEQIQERFGLAVVKDCLDMLKSERLEKEILQIVVLFIKNYGDENFNLVSQLIETIIKAIRSKGTSKKIRLKSEKNQSLQKQQSEAIIQFLEASYDHISKQIKQEKNRGLQETTQPQQIIDICKELLLVVHSSAVNRIFDLLSKANSGIVGEEKLYLSQILINCSPFHLQRQFTQKRRQVQIISYIFSWLGRLTTQQRQKIRNSLGLQDQSSLNKNSQFSLIFFVDFIEKSIETQFQYQLNREIVTSVINLLCYLSPAIHDLGNIKQKIIQIIKMLLNLNQSCEKQHRQLIINLIIKVLCVYSSQIVKDNMFLKEVLQKKLLDRICQCKEEVNYLVPKKIVTDQFFQKLKRKIESNEVLFYSQSDLQFLFNLLVQIDRQKSQQTEIQWQWVAYLHTAGKRLFRNQWIIPEKYLRTARQKMSSYPIEFGQDIAKIESLLEIYIQ